MNLLHLFGLYTPESENSEILYIVLEAFSGFAIPTLLQKYIHHFTILVNGSP